MKSHPFSKRESTTGNALSELKAAAERDRRALLIKLALMLIAWVLVLLAGIRYLPRRR